MYIIFPHYEIHLYAKLYGLIAFNIVFYWSPANESCALFCYALVMCRNKNLILCICKYII